MILIVHVPNIVNNCILLYRLCVFIRQTYIQSEIINSQFQNSDFNYSLDRVAGTIVITAFQLFLDLVTNYFHENKLKENGNMT